MSIGKISLKHWFILGALLVAPVARGQGTSTNCAPTPMALMFNTMAQNSPVNVMTNFVNLFEPPSGTTFDVPPDLRPFQLELPQDHLLGDWYGLRTKLENAGFTPTLTF